MVRLGINEIKDVARSEVYAQLTRSFDMSTYLKPLDNLGWHTSATNNNGELYLSEGSMVGLVQELLALMRLHADEETEPLLLSMPNGGTVTVPFDSDKKAVTLIVKSMREEHLR